MNARCVSDIVAVLEDMGRHRYGGEPVSQLEHALQCAALAERHGAEPALVVAALLHDIGHLVDADAESAAERGTDRHHELCGGRWLSGLLDDDVVEPVRLHVAAKRWLTATDPDYFSGLSPASVRSLELQGGPFSADEAADFIGQQHARAAVSLRRWDDDAKVAGAATPSLEHFLPVIRECARTVM